MAGVTKTRLVMFHHTTEAEGEGLCMSLQLLHRCCPPDLQPVPMVCVRSHQECTPYTISSTLQAGEFQCYDQRALASLAEAAAAVEQPEWGKEGPHDAGEYNSWPEVGTYVTMYSSDAKLRDSTQGCMQRGVLLLVSPHQFKFCCYRTQGSSGGGVGPGIHLTVASS